MSEEKGAFWWLPPEDRIKLKVLIAFGVFLLIFWIISFVAILLHPDHIVKGIMGIIFMFLTWVALGHAKELKSMSINMPIGGSIAIEQKEA